MHEIIGVDLSVSSKYTSLGGVTEFLHSINDEPDFQDPFSPLNLFLFQEIKEYMRTCGCSKKWSIKIQDQLIEIISPKFQKKFPHLRLGIAALKKTWAKMSCLLSHIQNEKEAITQDGKLNISFFVRENLKQLPLLATAFHPSLYAHQLAIKISEYIAIVDGVKPHLDQLTRIIWSLQRHLLPQSHLSPNQSPYDEHEKIDKLIIKLILETSAKNAEINQCELEHQVKESIKSLQELPSFSCLDTMKANIAALLADKLYCNSPFHSLFLEAEKKAIFHFLHRQLALCKQGSLTFQHTDLVRRILALYTLASQLPKNLNDQEIASAVRAVYPLLKEDRPDFAQSIYAFIAAELILAKSEEYCYSIESSCEAIIHAYHEAKCLPQLQDKELAFLEIVIWKLISENEGLLEKLPYCIGHRIEEEIANILIDDPFQTFNGIIQKTVTFFQQIKELTSSKKWIEIERKIHTWTLQNEMIYSTINIDADRPLVYLIEELGLQLPYKQLICEVAHTYLTRHPELLDYMPQLQLKITILYKYIWYKKKLSTGHSSFDRFLIWHAQLFCSQSSHLNTDHMIKFLEERCTKKVPLMPFNIAKCKELLSLFCAKEEVKSQEDKR